MMSRAAKRMAYTAHIMLKASAIAPIVAVRNLYRGALLVEDDHPKKKHRSGEIVVKELRDFFVRHHRLDRDFNPVDFHASAHRQTSIHCVPSDVRFSDGLTKMRCNE